MPNNDDTKTLEQLEADYKKAQEQNKVLSERVSALESENHDLKVKNEALHELSLHQTTKGAKTRLMEDFD